MTVVPASKKVVPTPSADKRWRIIDAAMRRNGYGASALIESMHAAQECFGYLDTESLRYIARSLSVPLSKAFGVATFYHYFTLKPPGKHTCVVCLGTACYIKGAAECLAALGQKYQVDAGQTTRDGELSLLTARCVGSCMMAPVFVLDGAVVGKLEPAEIVDRVEKWIGHAS
jgi:bidirectional [NiFe] hydrogenase diaphorase subunit